MVSLVLTARALRFLVLAQEADMFDRGLNGSVEKTKTPVRITLTSGETLLAQVSIPGSGKLLDTLNRAEPFFEVDLSDASSRILAKQAILSMTAIAAPKGDELQRAQKGWSFDPHSVLGINAAATTEEIRAAYMSKVKAYHPDRFVSLGLPAEVEAYAASMLQRINTAYQALTPRVLEAA
jgi:DnaJ domain